MAGRRALVGMAAVVLVVGAGCRKPPPDMFALMHFSGADALDALRATGRAGHFGLPGDQILMDWGSSPATIIWIVDIHEPLSTTGPMGIRKVRVTGKV